ncbi:uncharacterized protein PpBr36_09329 [Pyricularia pennisetigena]|uniref:uncharacterized protein n=1 Tax=Pyricularia pennisetigena TaxID=1578925 RepID=UPI0011538C75|nr:uncharacterized protein PpBr36_09329 [Pyricularia pennisetigena]TLS22125.1 hypothetical protein PpBr36_09329 [Pyricularia pennisetigena]
MECPLTLNMNHMAKVFQSPPGQSFQPTYNTQQTVSECRHGSDLHANHHHALPAQRRGMLRRTTAKQSTWGPGSSFASWPNETDCLSSDFAEDDCSAGASRTPQQDFPMPAHCGPFRPWCDGFRPAGHTS